MKTAKSEQLLEDVRELIGELGIAPRDEKDFTLDKLDEYLMPALSSAKGIQSSLYSWQPPSRPGVFRKVKNKVMIKIKNLIVNIMERTVTKQQKYNEVNYMLLQALLERQKELEARLNERN